MKEHLYDLLRILFIGILIFVIGLSYMLLDNKIPNFIVYITSIIIIFAVFLIYRMYKKNTLIENYRKFIVFIITVGLLVVFGLFINNSSNDKSITRNIIEKKVQKSINKDKKSDNLFNKEELNNYKKANLENKIKILKSLGLTKEEVSFRLKNDMKFKELTKNGIEDFNTIYNSK